MREDKRLLEFGSRSSLLRERAEVLTRIAELSDAMHGSVFSRYSTCSRPSCSCHQGNRHGPRSYFVFLEKGRQRQHYIPQDKVDVVQRGVKQYNELLRLIDQMTVINLKLLATKPDN
jgi:hypothetical protein